MADTTVLGGAINFLGKIGFYDYILPFILVFTILYAIFEKTKVLGTEIIDGVTYPKKNLNAMVSFVIAMFVIVSDAIVGVITQTSTYMVVLILASVFFMILVGSFHKEGKEPFFLEGKWKTTFTWIMFVGLMGIFLSALKSPTSNKSWLSIILNSFDGSYTGEIASTIILLGIIGGFIMLITKENKPKRREGED